jgi:hypothetical protein
MDRTFFDIHMHAMDLSHPNLVAFINRIHGLGLDLIFGGVAETFLKNEVLNLLTVMENNIEDYFILMEYFLKSKQPAFCGAEGPIRIGGREFDTILLTPLVVDFGFKHIKTDTFYNMALGKPVDGQTVDNLNAIKKYCSFEFKPTDTDDGTAVPRISQTVFEIYPFLGINPVNYEYNDMQTLLQRCFSGYTGLRENLKSHMGKFDGVLKNVGSNVFAGVKLYPPLGFDPWPDGKPDEMKKIIYMYDLCVSKQIPVTIHCSDGGFIACAESADYTNPLKWREVLHRFPGLKLNLAHFGNQGKIFAGDSWRETVIELIIAYDNVYTDISCLGFDEGFYGKLKDVLHDPDTFDRLASRIMFGTDFMIDLLWGPSYNDYLARFIQTNEINDEVKVKMCNENPARFLFK